jgi:WD40 repeat protein
MNVEVVSETALLRTRQIPDYPLRYCSFTEDSSVIVACGYSHTEALAVDNGELLGSWPQGFPSVSRAVAMHPLTGRIASIDDSGAVHIRDIESGMDALVRSNNSVRYYHRQLSYSPDGRWLAICSDEGLIELWQADSLEPVIRWQKILQGVCRIVFSPDNRYLIAGNDQKKTQAWRIVTGDSVPALDSILAGLIAFRPDGRQLVTVARDNGSIAVSFWQWPERRFQLELKSRHTILQSKQEELFYSPHGHMLALLTAAHVLFWDATMGVELGYVTGFSGFPNRAACAFTPDGTRFIGGDAVGIVRIWDSGNGELVALLSGHSHEVSSIAVSPDGTQFTSADTGGVLRIWDLKRCEGVWGVRGHTSAISALAMGAAGDFIASGDFEGRTYMWNLLNDTEKSCPALDDDYVRELLFRPDQRQLAVMGGKSLKVFENGQTVFSFAPEHLPGFNNLTALDFSQDNRQLAVGYNRSSMAIKVWDNQTGVNSTLTGLAGTEKMVFASTQSVLMILACNGKMAVWNVANGCREQVLSAALASLAPQPGSVSHDRDGECVVWLSRNQLVFWDRLTGTLNQRKLTQDANQRFTIIRPDGRQLAVWGKAGRISLWSVRQRQCIGRLDSDRDITVLSYSSSGRSLAAGRSDGSLAIWSGALSVRRRKLLGMQLPDAIVFLPQSSALTEESWNAVVQVEFAMADQFLLVLDQAGRLRCWDSVRQAEHELPAGLPVGEIATFAVADSWLVVVAGAQVFVADLKQNSRFSKLGEHEGVIRAIRVDRASLVVATVDALEIRRWDIATGILLSQWDIQETSDIAISPEGRYLAAINRVTERVVNVWETQQYRLLQENCLPDRKPLRQLDFAGNGKAVHLVYEEPGREVWDLEKNELVAVEVNTKLEPQANSPWLLGAESTLAVFSWCWRTGELTQRTCLPYFPCKAWSSSDVFSPDLATVAVHLRGDWQLGLWDVMQQRKIAVLQHAAAINSICFSADGRQLVTGDDEGVVKIWDAETGGLQHKIDCRSAKYWSLSGIQQVALSPDGLFLATGQQDGWLLLWQIQTETNLFDLIGHLDSVSILEFSPNGRTLLSGDFAGAYKLWDVATGREIADLCPESRKGGRIFPARDWLPDGKHFVFADESSKVRVLSLVSGQVVAEWKTDIWRPTSLRYNPAQPEEMVLAGATGVVGLWRMNPPQAYCSCRATQGATQIRFSNNGKWLAAGDAKGRIVVLDSATGKELAKLAAPATIRHIGEFQSEDDWVTVVADTVKLSLYSLADAQPICVLADSCAAPKHYAISQDGRWEAVSFEAQAAVLWDVQSGEKRCLPDWGQIARMAFSADGNYLSVEHHSGQSLLWNTLQQAVIELDMPTGVYATNLLFLGDGTRLIGRIHRQTNLWDTKTGALQCSLAGKVRQPEWVSPNGQHVLFFHEGAQEFKVVDMISMIEIVTCAATGIHIQVSWSDDSRTVCLGHDNRGPKWLRV